MIHCRPFRNDDPPALARLWNEQRQPRGLVSPMTASLLDQGILSKPYFDHAGLLVAEEDGKVVGFAHASFGPNEAGNQLSCAVGTTSLLLVGESSAPLVVGQALLAASEAYLTQRGAARLYAGPRFPIDPFYWGWYGGALSSGILQSDSCRNELFQRAGYQAAKRFRLWERNLYGFRPAVDRQQLQLKRNYSIDLHHDLATPTWWDACTIGQAERLRFDLRRTTQGDACASLVVWDKPSVIGAGSARTVGILETTWNQDACREGLTTCLLGEALRQLQSHGADTVEAVTADDDVSFGTVLVGLGFKEVDQSVVWEKSPH